MKTRSLPLVALAALPLASVPALAQGEAAPPQLPEQSAWKFSLTAYLWIPAQDGTVTVNGQSSSVDLDVGDTFDLVKDNFNFALALHFEAGLDRLALFADAMYLSLESGDVPLNEETTGSLGLDNGFFELGAAWAVLDEPIAEGPARIRVEPLAGARIYYLEGTVDPNGAPSMSNNEAWVDGFAGARMRLSLNEALALVLRGDVGAGGSDLAWSALGAFEFNYASWGSVQIGYRALDVDYDSSGFGYDVLLHGPFVAFTFRF